MKGRIVDMAVGMNGNHRITLELNNDRERKNFLEKKYDYLKDKDLKINIEKWRNRRTADANSYFHVLLNKIAAERDEGSEEVKTQLVLEYGAVAKDGDGKTIGFKLPITVDVTKIYRYVKCFDTRTEAGVDFHCYLAYKHTSDMDTKEMYRLIEGTIKEAQELGIETDTPEQLEKYKSYWERAER